MIVIELAVVFGLFVVEPLAVGLELSLHLVVGKMNCLTVKALTGKKRLMERAKLATL